MKLIRWECPDRKEGPSCKKDLNPMSGSYNNIGNMDCRVLFKRFSEESVDQLPDAAVTAMQKALMQMCHAPDMSVAVLAHLVDRIWV